VREVYRELERRKRLLTRFGEQIDWGPLTVFLTGNGAATAAFEKLSPRGAPYLAMGNREPPDRKYQDHPVDYFPAGATAFYRVFNFEWVHVEPDRPQRHGPMEPAARNRLRALVQTAREKGYWLRTWTPQPGDLREPGSPPGAVACGPGRRPRDDRCR